MNWILHIVGETIDDDLAPAISNFVKEVQTTNNKVIEVRLTTDSGEKVISVDEPAASKPIPGLSAPQ
jgi:hypothetical protein